MLVDVILSRDDRPGAWRSLRSGEMKSSMRKMSSRRKKRYIRRAKQAAWVLGVILALALIVILRIKVPNGL